MRLVRLFLAFVVLVVFGWSSGASAIEVFTSNPLSTISQSGENTVLHKELYAAYNYPTRYSQTGTDILGHDDSATWTFDLGLLGLDISDYDSVVTVALSIALDDHVGVPSSNYTGVIDINGNVVLDGEIPALHGTPFGGQFENYSTVSYSGPFLGSLISVSMSNLSFDWGGWGNWIAIDYIDVTLSPVPVPEPSTALLLGLGLAGMAIRKRR